MKTFFTSKMAFLFILIGLSFSCKKKEPMPVDENAYTDSTETVIDSVDTTVDSAMAAPDGTATKVDTIKKIKK